MESLRCLRPSTHALGIFIALACVVTLSAANAIEANWDRKPYKAFEYDKNLVLQCNITQSSGSQYRMSWWKDGKELVAVPQKVTFTEDNKLIVTKVSDEDVGNYTCQAVDIKTNANATGLAAVFTVIGMPKIILADDTPVVEGERLRLHCNVRGNPTPVLDWSIDDKAINPNTSDGRIKFEADKNVDKAYLVIEAAQMSDRNHYKCKATNTATDCCSAEGSTGVEKTTYVRVKDKLAALWPFLGICAEVAVLCTIILIYEKKRNKTELDESDTDQSPEQKNTPDHGKDVRQRK